MSIFVQGAASAIAAALKANGVWVGWGNGSPAWDSVAVPEPYTATALVAEVGRRRSSIIEHVVSDPNGAIILTGVGSFSVSATPTSLLYVRANFAKADGVGQAIREAAVFIGTTIAAGQPVGKDYFEPGVVTNGGTMLMLERFARIDRSADYSVSLQFVISL